MADSAERQPKQVVIIAVLGVIIITAGAVVALAYNAIVHGGGTDGLTTIAAVGAGGLVSALGAAKPTTHVEAPGTAAEPARVAEAPPADYEAPEPVPVDEPDDGVPGFNEGLSYSPDNGPDALPDGLVGGPSDAPPAGEF